MYMLELEERDNLMVSKGVEVWCAEDNIDFTEALYLITWSPNPSELPNADFTTQHMYFVNILADYLKTCKNGLFCVETSQMGSPHYHGWYQVSPDPIREELRIVYTKTLVRFGMMRITKSRGKVRVINSYNPRSSFLSYYKKDLLDSMLWCKPNPITSTSKCDIDWSKNMLFFVKEGRGTVADLEEKISLKEFYLEFYKDSSSTIVK